MSTFSLHSTGSEYSSAGCILTELSPHYAWKKLSLCNVRRTFSYFNSFFSITPCSIAIHNMYDETFNYLCELRGLLRKLKYSAEFSQMHFFQSWLYEICAFLEKEFRNVSITLYQILHDYSMELYLLITSMAPLMALLSVAKCTVHTFILLNSVLFVSKRV